MSFYNYQHQNKPRSTPTLRGFLFYFLYKNDILQQIDIPGGRIIKNNDAWHYEYYLTDHTSTGLSTGLGNTRVVFTEENGIAQAQQTTNYYPFGMVINQENHTSFNSNNFLYNGKRCAERSRSKLQRNEFSDFDLGWYDYGARMYDASIGRFTTHDPLADMYYQYSPYNYVGGNPIIRVDENGEFWNYVVGGAIGAAVDYGSQVVGNMANGHSFTESLTHDIDKSSIFISTIAGIASSGTSAFGSTTAKVVASSAIDAVSGGVNEMVNNVEDGKNTMDGVVEATVISVVSGKAGEAVGKLTPQINTGNLQMVADNTSSRATRVPKAGTQAKASQAQASLNSAKIKNQAGTDVVSGTVSKVNSAIIELSSPPNNISTYSQNNNIEKPDNTSAR